VSMGEQSKLGKPCERFNAPQSAANFDMIVKMVVPVLGCLEFIIMLVIKIYKFESPLFVMFCISLRIQKKHAGLSSLS
jgi:hypothetical protein